MIPAADERGQSVVIGSILIFGIAILLLGIFQAVGVPAANEEIEFKHNQELQSDMQSLDAELSRAASTGTDSVTKVRIGTQYPSRFILINPPSPTGTLQTRDQSSVILAHAEAEGATGDYLDGSNKTFETNAIVYRPNYHAYQGAPETVISVGVTYNRFHKSGDDTFVTLGGDIINGKTISFITTDGNLSDSGLTTKIHSNPISAPKRTVTVTNSTASNNVTLRIPSEMPASKWRVLLADEFTTEGGHIVRITDSGDHVNLVLEQGVTYKLRMGKVGVGTGANETNAHYLIPAEGDNSAVGEFGSRILSIQVLDRFNNPITGSKVKLKLGTDEGTIEANGEVADANEELTLKTDSDGMVTFQYNAPDAISDDNKTVKIHGSLLSNPDWSSFDSNTRVNTTLSVRVINTTTRDQTEPLFNPFDGVVLQNATFHDADCEDDGNDEKDCEVRIDFENKGNTTAEITEMRYTFYGGDSQGQAAKPGIATAEIQSNGEILEFAGDYKQIDLNITDNATGNITLHVFTDENQDSALDMDEGEFIVIELIINDVRKTYFIPLLDAS